MRADKIFGHILRKNNIRIIQIILFPIKAELSQEGILFGTQFPFLGFFINKNVGFPKI